MRKNFKWLALLLVSVCMLLPLSIPTVQAQGIYAKVIDVSASSETVGLGGTVTLTITTNAATNYVIVKYDDHYERATFSSTDAAGNQVWTIDCHPLETQSITAYANTNDSIVGPAVGFKSIRVNVSQDAVSILSVEASAPEVSQGDYITYTVVTNAQANYVWVQENGELYTLGTQNVSGVASQKEWTISITPEESQTLVFSANTAYSSADADTFEMDVAVTDIPADPAEITSVSASRYTLTAGASSLLTIRTNAQTEFVWAVADGERVDARLQRTSGNIKSWSVTVSPDSTQSVDVYANTLDRSEYADISSVSFTVTDRRPNQYSAYVTIESARAEWAGGYTNGYYYDYPYYNNNGYPYYDPYYNYNYYNNGYPYYNYNNYPYYYGNQYYGGSISATVVTNGNAEYVWAEAGGGNYSLSYQSTDGNGDKTWSGTFTPTLTGYNYSTIDVHAGINSNEKNSSQTVTVSGYNGYYYEPYYSDPYYNYPNYPYYYQGDITGITPSAYSVAKGAALTLTVSTTGSVSSVSLTDSIGRTFSPTSTSASSGAYTNTWTFTVDTSAYAQGSSYTFTATSYNYYNAYYTTGSTDTSQITISVY